MDGGADEVDILGGVDAVVGLAGFAVVVLVGIVAVAEEVTGAVDGSPVTVLGSPVGAFGSDVGVFESDVAVVVAVAVPGSVVGGSVTVTVDVEVGAPRLGIRARGSWTGKLTVAEKLALTEISIEFGGAASVVTVADVSGTDVSVVESVGGGVGSVSVSVSADGRTGPVSVVSTTAGAGQG
ncbi:hypothetical protein [Nocardia asteroides]